MTIHYQDDAVTLHHGDCLDILATLPDASVDSVVCDPPYGISFMGRQWDQPGQFGSQRSKGTGEALSRTGSYDHKTTRERGGAMAAGEYDLSPSAMLNFQSWCTAWATECLRVLKPGGHILAFGGSRTWHRLASAIEDSGFEIRDSIAWLYGSGFPKSLDVSKAIDKAAGATREVTGQRDKFTGSDKDANTFMASPRLMDITAPATDAAKQWQGYGTSLKPAFEPVVVARKPLIGTVAANVQAHGTGALNIDATRVHSADALAGRTRHGGGIVGNGSSYELPDSRGEQPAGRWPTNVVLDDNAAAELDTQSGNRPGSHNLNRNEHVGRGYGTGSIGNVAAGATTAGYNDQGGASRFFPVFKYQAKAPTSERPSANGIQHATVKPVDLMRWLIRLVTPPGGLVLDPFAGSGTTAEACIHEHMRCITIEREADYLPVIVARLSKPMAIGFDFESEPA